MFLINRLKTKALILPLTYLLERKKNKKQKTLECWSFLKSIANCEIEHNGYQLRASEDLIHVDDQNPKLSLS